MKTAHVSHLEFPGARQAIKITHWRRDTATGSTSRQTVYAVGVLVHGHLFMLTWPGVFCHILFPAARPAAGAAVRSHHG